MLFSAPPYIFTNEVGTTATIDTLQTLPKRRGHRLHIGVSGLFNYDIIAARKSDGAILWDINEETQRLHKLVQATIYTSVTSEDFITKFAKTIQTIFNRTLLERNPCFLEDLRYEASNRTSWLAQEDSYQHIRSLYQKHCVHIGYGNWLDGPALGRVTNWVRQNNWSLDTAYLSNCGDASWMKISQSLVDSQKTRLPHHTFSLQSHIVPLLQTGTYVIETSSTIDLNQKICKIQKKTRREIVNHPIFTYQRPLYEHFFVQMTRNPNQTGFFLFVITILLVCKWLQMTTVNPNS